MVGPFFAGAIAFLMAISNHGLGPLRDYSFDYSATGKSSFGSFGDEKTVGISPVVVVVALLPVKIAGFIGGFLAVPTAVVIQEIISDWERRKLKHLKME